MKLSDDYLRSLDLVGSAKETVSRPLLQMPLLVSDRALKDQHDLLAEYAFAHGSHGGLLSMETIAMPKHGYGPRPIGILSPANRTLYHAAVTRLRPSLPAPSRDQGIDAHQSFGIDGERSSSERVVDLDIAACYEYIDHQTLADELLLQSLDPEGVTAITSILRDFFPRGVGLPQAIEASHWLADAYLDRMQRGLLRRSFEVNRFADDFRIIASDWDAAHDAIDAAIELAREIGLTLSDGKTSIRSAKQLRKADEERTTLWDAYKQKAADNLRSIEMVQIDYDDWELEEVEASDEDLDFAALRGIVEDWVKTDREQRSLHAYFGPQALRALRRAPDRLPDEWLVEVATREPIRLRSVVIYVLGRSEADANRATLAALSRIPRLSPWSKLWILRVADTLQPPVPGGDVLTSWVEACLADRYEVVRAEAAWVLARGGKLQAERVARLYVDATPVTQVGLAAVVGRLDGDRESKVGRALRSQSRLTRAAYTWGTSAH